MTRSLSSAWWLACTLAFGALAGCSGESTATISPTGPAFGSMTTTDGGALRERGHFTALSSKLSSGLSSGLSSAAQDPLGLESGGERLPEDLHEPLLANQTVATPFPDRTDPFEFGKGVVFDSPQSQEREAQRIQLYGFAGVEQPKAIIHIDGKTKMLSAGETWGVLEILDVSPPTVRIKANGVARVWSLLGHHEETGL